MKSLSHISIISIISMVAISYSRNGITTRLDEHDLFYGSVFRNAPFFIVLTT